MQSPVVQRFPFRRRGVEYRWIQIRWRTEVRFTPDIIVYVRFASFQRVSDRKCVHRRKSGRLGIRNELRIAHLIESSLSVAEPHSRFKVELADCLATMNELR